jgi:outer membrane lipoprotein-sorting protein
MTQKIHNNQNGIAHLMLILVVIVIAGVGGAGYYVWNKQKDSSGSAAQSAAQKVAEAECKKEIDDKDFCKFVSNVNFDEDYKATISTVSPEGTSVMSMESSKDDMKVVTTVNGAEVSAFITIGNASYMKNIADNTWTKYVSETTATTDEIADDVTLDIDEEILADNTKYEKVGKEACGSLNCFKYKITDTEDATSEQFVWFDDKDYKLRRYTFKNAEGSSDMVYSYESVNITEPSPIVEAPDYENMSEEELQAALEAAMQQ